MALSWHLSHRCLTIFSYHVNIFRRSTRTHSLILVQERKYGTSKLFHEWRTHFSPSSFIPSFFSVIRITLVLAWSCSIFPIYANFSHYPLTLYPLPLETKAKKEEKKHCIRKVLSAGDRSDVFLQICMAFISVRIQCEKVQRGANRWQTEYAFGYVQDTSHTNGRISWNESWEKSNIASTHQATSAEHQSYR